MSKLLELVPSTGFQSTVRRHEARQGALTGDSRDVHVLSKTGAVRRRSGSVIVGDTFGAQAGLLDAKWSARPRALLEFPSPSLADGQPTHALLMTNESTVLGQLYFRNTNPALDTNDWLGKSFASEYPVAAVAAPNDFKMVPLWTEHAQVFTRCATSLQRRMYAAGSRNVVEAQGQIYFPNLQATPAKHNRAFNDSTVSTNNERLWHAGHAPPVWPGYISAGAVAGAVGDESWEGRDRFYYSLVFEFEDGSRSPHFIPHTEEEVPTNPATSPRQNWCGYVSWINSVSANKYAYIRWTIPVGPPGTKRRLFYRTPKKSSSANQTPDIRDLRLSFIVEGNEPATFDDYNGNDDALVADSTLRQEPYDHDWPRRARFGAIAAERMLLGYLKPHPTGLVIAPVRDPGGTAPHTFNDETAVTARRYTIAVVEDQTVVAGANGYVAIRGKVNGVAASLEVSLIATAYTLRQVCSEVFQFWVVAPANEEWGCVVPPGTPAQAPASNLELTQLVIPSATTNLQPTVTPQATMSFANVKVGMKVFGTNIPAGTYVGSVGVNIGLVNAAGAAVNATGTGNVDLTYGWEFGDDNNTALTMPGEMRVFAPSYPALLPFKKSYLDGFAVQKRSVQFSHAGPGSARVTPDVHRAQNLRTAPDSAGILTGLAPLNRGAVVGFGKAFMRFENVRDSGTNVDDDFQLVPFIDGFGLIAPASLVAGNGWVGGLTQVGYVITDGERYVTISNDLYDPDNEVGELAYEVEQCAAAAAADTDAAYCSAALIGRRLYLTYRSSAAVSYPDRTICYDMTDGIAASGLADVLDRRGRPFPWSAPWSLRLSVMGGVRRSDGLHKYGAIDANAGGTGDGRIDEFDTGTQDNGVSLAPVAYGPTTFADTQRFKRARRIRAVHRKNGTGLTVALARDASRSAFDAVTLPTTGAGDFARDTYELPLISRSRKPTLELRIQDDGSGDPFEVDHLALEYDEVAGNA